MNRSQAVKRIEESRNMRLDIIQEQGTTARLNDMMKQACEACDSVVDWEDQMEAGLFDSIKKILCPNCYIEFVSDYSERFECWDAERFVRWYRNQINRPNCRWCGANLDPTCNY